MTGTRALKYAWKDIKRKAENRRTPGVVDDPLPHRLETYVRHRLLWGRRLVLAAGMVGRRVEDAPSRPIFIVGCPRSGTTLLFRLLQRHRDLSTPNGEGHLLWNKYQHPKHRGWASDRSTARDVAPGEPEFLYTAIHRIAGGTRFLDKTPRNSLKIPYLAQIFPDASFVLLKRNGPATVSSLIEGWTVRHGVSYRLPFELNLAEYRGNSWCYLLPPGWRDLAQSSIREIAAHQYVSSYETALDDLAAIPASRVVDITFEELLSRPLATISGLLEALDLPVTSDVSAMAENLSAHEVQTNSPPHPDKWKNRADDIRRVLPIIRPTMKRLGYDGDPSL